MVCLVIGKRTSKLMVNDGNFHGRSSCLHRHLGELRTQCWIPVSADTTHGQCMGRDLPWMVDPLINHLSLPNNKPSVNFYLPLNDSIYPLGGCFQSLQTRPIADDHYLQLIKHLSLPSVNKPSVSQFTFSLPSIIFSLPSVSQISVVYSYGSPIRFPPAAGGSVAGTEAGDLRLLHPLDQGVAQGREEPGGTWRLGGRCQELPGVL